MGVIFLQYFNQQPNAKRKNATQPILRVGSKYRVTPMKKANTSRCKNLSCWIIGVEIITLKSINDKKISSPVNNIQAGSFTMTELADMLFSVPDIDNNIWQTHRYHCNNN